ncbi:MAG: glycosyltransferase family 2 protein, partial [Chloroflexus sp.]|nr:glycosyltransferase family 2 protein [Chloroflexus sp.]
MHPFSLPPHPLDPARPVYGYAPADPSAQPVVSIVTPCYNAGAMFLDTIRSVLRQSLQQWEWIIVNDGSDDAATLRVLDALRAVNDPRVRVVDQLNLGPAAARNAGVTVSRAPLLFFLDSDDLIAPTALEQLAWALASRPEITAVTTWRVLFGAMWGLSRRGFASRHMFPHDNPLASVSVMLRRTAFEHVGGFDESLRDGLEDYEFWMRLADAGMWGRDIREALVWIRRKPAEMYRGYRWNFQTDRAALPRMRRALRARYPRVFRDGPPRPPDEPSPILQPHPLIMPDPPFENRLAPRGE